MELLARMLFWTDMILYEWINIGMSISFSNRHVKFKLTDACNLMLNQYQSIYIRSDNASV